MNRPHLLARFAGDRRGLSIVEFGLISPVLMIMVMGSLDLAHTLYMTAALQGAVQKAARDSTLETNDSAAAAAALDAKVVATVKALDSDATVPTPTRRYYKDYAAAAAKQAETWSDANGNGTCDANESYQDANGNGVWDADGGNAGVGGAQDRTIYTVTVNYPRLFPIAKFVGISPNVSMQAVTVLANQPYEDQSSYAAPVTRHCT